MSHENGHESCFSSKQHNVSNSHTCSCHCHAHHKYRDELLELADVAWMEVLKEKIKEQILHYSEEHLNRIAKLVAESNHKRWIHKMDGKRNLDDFETDLKNITTHQS